MRPNFQVIGIDQTTFNALFQLNEQQLSDIGAVRIIAKSKPGYPCRVGLKNAEIGEELILFTYEHHKVHSPYRSKGPIFIRKNAINCNLKVNEIPEMLTQGLLSLRGYDERGIMLKATTIKGVEIETTVKQYFQDKFIAYIHVHNSSPGCFNCEIRRK